MDRDAEQDFTSDTTDNADAQFAGTGGVAYGITSPETGGDPGESDLTSGGMGSAVNSGQDSGGAGGSGGGLVGRIGGRGTTGGMNRMTLEEAQETEREAREDRLD